MISRKTLRNTSFPHLFIPSQKEGGKKDTGNRESNTGKRKKELPERRQSKAPEQQQFCGNPKQQPSQTRAGE